MKNKVYRSVPNIRNTYGHMNLPEPALDARNVGSEILIICKKYSYIVRKHRGKMIARRMEKDAKK